MLSPQSQDHTCCTALQVYMYTQGSDWKKDAVEDINEGRGLDNVRPIASSRHSLPAL